MQKFEIFSDLYDYITVIVCANYTHMLDDKSDTSVLFLNGSLYGAVCDFFLAENKFGILELNLNRIGELCAVLSLP